MKHKNNYLKNLFKTELNIDFAKIILVLFIYVIILFIFKSGYDFQSVIPFREKENVEALNKINYQITINGQESTLKFDSRKSLLSIIESVPYLNIEIIGYYEGTKIKSINGSQNVTIKLNGVEIKNSTIDKSFSEINSDSIIEVSF